MVELSLSENRLVKITPKHAVFGQDSILLQAGAAAKVREVAKPKTGFLARLFGSETIQETAEIISRTEQAKPRKPVEKKPTPEKKAAKKPAKKKAAKKKPAKKSARTPARKTTRKKTSK